MNRKLFLSVILSVMLAATLTPMTALAGESTGNEETAQYVEFGSYPQTEIVAQAETCGTYGKDWSSESDYAVDSELYATLENLSEDKWSSDGDVVVDGSKYRRIKAGNATYSTSGDGSYYDWSSSDVYHYFKYEPITWRVLERTDGDCFLLSEAALDTQKYNTVITNLTWETSTVRSWLNGYDGSANLYGTDYSTCSFLDTAFTSSEQAKIKTTAIENKDNSKSGIEGGNDTNDKIYLLSEDEVYGSTAAEYGFASSYKTNDTARQAKSTTYAKAMGACTDCESSYLGNCDWWLRSPGVYTGLAVTIKSGGSVYRGGQHMNSKSRGIRPALHVDLDAEDPIEEPEPAPVETPVLSEAVISPAVYEYTGTAVVPSVTVKDSLGNSIDPSDCEITYENNNAVGTATATVTSKKYEGTVTAEFTINPANVALDSLTSGRKGSMTAAWTRPNSACLAQMTGYQLRYGTDSAMNDAVTVTLDRRSMTSRTVTKLKTGKTYYVQLRTYKTAGSETYYSDWSMTKSVTAK